MSNKIIDTRQGHWLLSKMGKKVLRPGGRELTQKMIKALHISPDDRVLEFAPGLGYTAFQVIKKNPRTYTGIELNEEAAALLRDKITGPGRQIIVGDASRVPLKADSVDKLYGEAMLTMQADHRKSFIIREAHRLLQKGGLYGIHELGLTPDYLSEEEKSLIQKDLSMCIKVNARPLTRYEWINLLEKEGFKVISIATNPMLLLNISRIIEDEGFLRSIRIGINIIRQPAARRRIIEMRCVFNKYRNQMNAVAIVCKKL